MHFDEIYHIDTVKIWANSNHFQYLSEANILESGPLSLELQEMDKGL